MFDQDPRRIFHVALAAALVIKLVGYLLASVVLNKAFESKQSVFAPALVRTGIGAVAGYLYVSAWGFFGPLDGSILFIILFYLGLFAARVAQWWLVLWLFWDGAVRAPARGWACAVVGALWSHFLDVPALVIYAWTAGKLMFAPDGFAF
jgi:hypothetical protein